MPATRSSARIASKQGTSSPKAATGTKRKADSGSSPAAKRGKKSTEKEQKTIEESFPSKDEETKENATEVEEVINEPAHDQEPTVQTNGEVKPEGDVEMKDEGNTDGQEKAEKANGEVKPDEIEGAKEDKKEDGITEPEKQKPTNEGEQQAAQIEQKQHEPPAATNGDSAVEPKAREDVTPSNILEKGIIYFFFRGRVGIDEPKDVDDIARSYIILRPIAHDAKLGEGPVGDIGNSRLIALPKKVLPLSGKDRFISFVEKAKVSFQTLKDEFLSASDYVTKTAGARHTPAATPAGEGVYAITTTGRESHLAYILTVPSDLGEVQKEVGLREKGSFIISTKNPEYPSPQNARLPKSADYPKEIQDEFRSLRWLPSNPKHLDFVNTQFLLIGESSGLAKATEPQKEDQENGKEEPQEELEKLEDEDTHRMQDLSSDDSKAIFTDLEARAKDYPKLQTTF